MTTQAPATLPQASPATGGLLRLSRIVAPLALIVVTLLAYSPALRGGWVWDDDYYVTGNVALRSASGLWRIWTEIGAVPQYYPVTHTTLWLEWRLWGDQPTGYHVANVLLHCASALLVGVILRRLAVPGWWLVPWLFALHPVHVESVAWVTERKNVLSALFYLASLWAYLRFVGATQVSPLRWRWYAVSMALFVCALLSKSVTSSLPAVVLLVTYWKRGRITKVDVLPLLPFFALGLAMGSLTGWMERHIVGAQGNEFDFTIADRVLIAGRAVWFYVTKLAWPNPLIFMYPRWRIDDHAPWQYAFPLAGVALVIALWLLRRRIGRGALVAALFFVGSLVPALGFVNVLPMRYSFVADHFQYLASLGLFTLFAVAVVRFVPRGMIPHVSVALCLALAIITWRHARDFSDLETLWQRTIAKNPSSWMAHNNYGVLLISKGRIPEAIHELETTMSLKPDHAESRLNLGVIAQHQGKLDEAERRFREAMSLRDGYVDAYYNLGSLYVDEGRLPEAIELLQQTVNLAPNHHAAHTNLGMAFARQGRTADAMKQYQTAIRLNPDATLAHVNLGALYLEGGDLDRAAAEWTEVVRLDPNDAMALNNLGIVQAQRGRLDEAEQYFRRSLASDPNYPDALTNLGIIYMKRGDAAAAANQFRHALRGDPKHARARAMLEQVENAR